jgi:hypothetical protein
MRKSVFVPVLGLVLFHGGSAGAQQPQQQYPIMDKVAQKIIDKYTNSTCEQLAASKSQKPEGQREQMEERAIQMLKSDPQMRKAFIDKIAAPIANKMFECGMIP